MSPTFANVNGTWKTVATSYVNVAGTWKTVSTPSVNVSGTWKSAASSVNISDATVFANLRSYLAARVGNYVVPSSYSYSLDSSATMINDGGGDMYDGGNSTHIYVSNNQSISNIAYNQGSTTGASSIQYGGLGYTVPLYLIMAGPRNTSLQYGFGKTGNLGADGGGAQVSYSLYDNTVVNGFTVIARMRHVYNAGDPSIGELYIAIAHPSFSSSAMSLNVWAYNPSTDGGDSRMEVTGTNILQMVGLLSRPSGGNITAAEAQTVIGTILTDIKASLGI
jgi:hypothetical protein